MEWVMLGVLVLLLLQLMIIGSQLGNIREDLRVIRNGVEFAVQTANQILNK